MAGNGPKVGDAHVETTLKFDEKSLAKVKKDIKRQLSGLTKDLAKVGDRNREIYQSIGRDSVVAWRSFMGSILAGAPLVGGAISGVAGAATTLAGAFYSAGQAAFGFAPILGAIGVAAGTAFIGLKSFFKALKDGDLSGLTPSAKAAAKAVQGLAGAWKKVRDTVQERMFRGLSDDIAKLGTTLLPVLQRGLGKMADSLNHLAQNILDYVNSSAGLRVINKFLNNSAEIFDRLQRAAVPFLDGFLRLLNALAPAGKRLADRITDIVKSFQDWTKGEGFAKRIDDAMKRAEKTAGKLWDILGNIGSALINVFNATNPATNRLLDMIVGLTQRFEDWTESVGGQDALAKWADQSVDVIEQFGRTMEAVFPVIAELADPRVIINFMKTVEGAFDLLAELPLDKMVDAFVSISEALQPVSSFFLAIILAGAGFNILLGGLIGQLGGVVSAAGRFGGGKLLGGLFKPLASAGAHGKELSGLAAAFGRIFGLLSRLAKFIPFVGWAVTFGIVIAKSEELRGKMGDLWDSVKDVGAAFGDAFAEIAEALEPLQPAAEAVGSVIGWLFDQFDALLGLIASAAIGNLIHMWEGFANVVRGFGSVIAGIINILVGLFTTDPSLMLKGLEQIGGGLVKILTGLGEILMGPALAIWETVGKSAAEGLINGLKSIGSEIAEFGMWIVDQVKGVLGISSPSTVFMEIGVWLVKGLVQGILSVGSYVVDTFRNIFNSVIGLLARLPSRLLALGVRAILVLGQAVTSNAPKVLAATGRMVSGIIRWIAKLPGRLLSLGAQAVSRLSGAITRGIPRILATASRIFSGVVTWIAKLPGRLLALGAQAVAKLGNAFRSGISNLRNAARDAVDAVMDVLTGLPGKITNLGGQMLSAGKTLGKKVIDGIRNGLSAAGGALSDIGTTVKNAVNSAMGLPKTISLGIGKFKTSVTVPGFARGGIVPGGLIAVGEGGPELMAPPRGSRIYSNSESKRMMASGLPKTLILRVGSRDFVAYLEEVADNRISASDNLAWQGA